jgi:hypothetical protein
MNMTINYDIFTSVFTKQSYNGYMYPFLYEQNICLHFKTELRTKATCGSQKQGSNTFLAMIHIMQDNRTKYSDTCFEVDRNETQKRSNFLCIQQILS